MIKYNNDLLYVEDLSLKEIAKDKPTPFYVYSLQQMRRNIDIINETFEGLNFHISFAAKANNNLYILEALKDMGVGIDIVSKGEFEAAKRVGFTNEYVVVNGNAKSDAFLREMLTYQPRGLNIDSPEELERLSEICVQTERGIKVALRVNPDVDPITHPYISTGLKKNKFGMDLETAAAVIKQYHSHPYIQINGLHLHIGSQLLYISPYEDAYSKVYDFISSLETHNLTYINIGGGWGIDYHKQGQDFPVEEYKEKVIPILKRFNMDLILEMGRYIIGNAGILVSKVEYIKRTPFKSFIVSDASMADLIRPSLYDGYHHIYPVTKDGEEELPFDVVGPICETGDRFAEDRIMTTPIVGDYIAICDTGAYGFAMSSNYNFTLRPAEYLIKDKGLVEIRPREDFDELVSYYKPEVL